LILLERRIDRLLFVIELFNKSRDINIMEVLEGLQIKTFLPYFTNNWASVVIHTVLPVPGGPWIIVKGYYNDL
jgi:hypothetical protein